MSRQVEFINEARTHTKALWDSINALEALQPEHTALDYGNTLAPGVGNNEGVTRAQVGAVVFDTANALRALMNAGHATNLAKLL